MGQDPLPGQISGGGRITSSWAVALRASAPDWLLAGGPCQSIATWDCPQGGSHVTTASPHQENKETRDCDETELEFYNKYRRDIPSLLPHSVHWKQAIRSSHTQGEEITQRHED